MTEVLRITVPAVPVAQPRQRHAVIGGHVRNYTPAKHPVQDFKATLRMAAQETGLPPSVLEGPIEFEAMFYLPRPKRLMRKKDPEGPIPHSSKPDRDNLEKSTVDALNGLVWRDDAQIYDGRVSKWYCEKNGRPRVELVIKCKEAK